MTFNEGFDRVAAWLAMRNYEVCLGPDMPDAASFEEERVYINSRQHSENRLYTLLHEAGHVLVNEARDGDRLYELSYQTHQEARHRPAKNKRVAVLSEEFEAWRRGELLAEYLGIEINPVKYDHERTKALMSYIDWASS
jgi:trehalose-6-phosphate synthase